MKLQILPARHGLLWVRLGVRTFWQQPLALSGLFFLFTACVSLLSLLPWLGMGLVLFLLPAISAGLMAATQAAAQGYFPLPSILLVAWRAGPGTRRAFATLGLLYVLGLGLILGGAALLDGGALARYYLSGEELTREMVLAPGFQAALWLTLLLSLPLSMMFWHAPALVLWHKVSPVKSLFFSLVACARNVGAMTLYGLTWAALALTLLMAVSLLCAVLGRPDLVGPLFQPASLLLGAMFFTSIFFTVRDSFVTPAPAAEPTQD